MVHTETNAFPAMHVQGMDSDRHVVKRITIYI